MSSGLAIDPQLKLQNDLKQSVLSKPVTVKKEKFKS